jgi:hypothetical protein
MNPTRARKRRAEIAASVLDPETRAAMRELERKIPDPAERRAYLDAIIPELDRLIEKDNNRKAEK